MKTNGNNTVSQKKKKGRKRRREENRNSMPNEGKLVKSINFVLRVTGFF